MARRRPRHTLTQHLLECKKYRKRHAEPRQHTSAVQRVVLSQHASSAALLVNRYSACRRVHDPHCPYTAIEIIRDLLLNLRHAIRWRRNLDRQIRRSPERRCVRTLGNSTHRKESDVGSPRSVSGLRASTTPGSTSTTPVPSVSAH